MKKTILIILTSLLGVVFLFSGYTKLFPIEPFQFNFIAIGIANWNTAPILARLIISAEFFLGIHLLFNFRTQFILKIVIGVLALFTIFLFYQIITEGNQGNCGCFGEWLHMTPLQSIAKNIAMIAVAAFLIYFKHTIHWKIKSAYSFLLVSISIAVTLVLNPFDYNASQILKEEITNLPLPTDTLYHSPNAHPKPSVDLKRGKYIVCFLSLRCEHCVDAAFKMNILKSELPETPFYFIYGGVKKDLAYFQQRSKYKDIPFTLFEDNYFFNMCGGQFPSIYFCEDGLIKRKENIYTLNVKDINSWLQSK